MEMTLHSRVGVWRSLLWKETYSIISMVVAVIIGLTMLQAGVWLVGEVYETQFRDSSAKFVALCLITQLAPVLIAIGCGGLLVGGERQQRTWEWNASVPINWQTALACKMVVSLIAALVAALTLCILPLLYELFYGSNVPGTTILLGGAFTAVITIECIVVFFLSCLLFREPMLALLAGAFWLVFGQLAIIAISVEFVRAAYEPLGVSLSSSEETAFISIILMLTLLATIGLIKTFRWRWTTGMDSNPAVGFTPSRRKSTVPEQPLVYSADVASRELPVAILLSLRTAWGMRLAIFAGYWLIAIYMFGTRNFVHRELLIFQDSLSMLAAALIGVTAFSQDNAREQFRFLADRGAKPSKLLIARLLPVLGCLVLVFAVNYWFTGPIRYLVTCDWWGSIGLLTAGLLGAWSSLCLRNSIVACTASIILTHFILMLEKTFLSYVLMINLLGFAEWDAQIGGPLFCLSLTAVFLVVALILCSYRWLVFGQCATRSAFMWVTPVAIVLPPILYLSLCFLLIPKTDWPGVSPEKTHAYGTIDAPELRPLPDNLVKTIRAASSTMPYGSKNASQMSPPMIWSRQLQKMRRVWTLYHEQGSSRKDSQDTNEQANVGVGLSLGELLSTSPISSNVRTYRRDEYARQLNQFLIQYAALAKVALEKEDVSLCLLAWDRVKQLHELAHRHIPLETYIGRSVALHGMATLTWEEIERMGGPEVYRDRIPPAAPERQAEIELQRQIASIAREVLRGERDAQDLVRLKGSHFSPTNFQVAPYPIRAWAWFTPLRWRAERHLAYQVNEQLSAVKNYPSEFLTGDRRATAMVRSTLPAVRQ